MLNLLKELHPGQLAPYVIVMILLWQFIAKSIFEMWSKNKFELQKEEQINHYQLQKEKQLKEVEFEKAKTERSLPILEQINHVTYYHKLIHNEYLTAIKYKSPSIEKREQERVELDKRFINNMTSINIYIPYDFRILLNRIRLIISSSFFTPKYVFYTLYECGNFSDVLSSADELYLEIINCFYDMSNKYIGITDHNISYKDILYRHNLDNHAETIKDDEINQLA